MFYLKYLRGNTSCLSIALLPLLGIFAVGNGPLDQFKRCDLKVEKRLEAAFSKRSLSCAPKAPIETEFLFAKDPVPGVTTQLVFRVMAMEPGPSAEVRFDLPKEMTLRGGNVLATGTLDRKRGYEFSIDVSIDQPGTFEVRATAMAGMKEARFGRRETIYITNDGATISLSRAKQVPQEGVPVLMGTNEDERITTVKHPDSWGSPPVTPRSQIKVDPRGNPLDPPEGGGPGPQANVTVSGYWRYRHDDGTLHGGYGTQVFFWDADSLSADDLMAQAVCSSSGYFTATFDNNDPEGGTTDLYLEFRTYNGAVNVHSSAGSGGWYSGVTTTWNNIANGTFDAGSWYYDTGTAGVADGIERAYEVCDTMSSAWSHSNYDLGFSPHYTYIQWYDGSTDGTYYNPPTDTIHLQAVDFKSPDVQMHEFGHNVMDSAYAEVYIPGSGGSHWFTNHYNTALAMSEGYATYYSCSAQGDDWTYNDNNPGNLIDFNCDTNWDGYSTGNGNSDNLSNNPNWGYDTESCVLALLLDIDDARNDSTDLYDWTSLGDNEIWDVIKNYDPAGANPHVYGIQQFYDGWFGRGWGYHPQINGQMHVHGMNQGISKPFLGISSGVSRYTGTWYYGGYGRGSYQVKNYGSINYDLDQLYVWLRGPANEDIGQFGGDGNGAVIPARTTRDIYLTADQTGYNPASPNFVYGTYTITAGHYRSDHAWQLLEPAEPGTDGQISVNVVQDTDAPDSCTVVDDGDCQNSSTTLHIYATAQDYDSSIKGYWTRVGTSAGAGDEQDWVFHDANNQTTFDYTFTGLSMNANTRYYVTVVARNIEGYDTWAYTDGIIAWDATPPGAVTVTDDGVATSSTTQLHFVATSSETDGCIAGYWTRVGTSAGAGDEQDWVLHSTGDVDSFDYTITGLTMNVGATYYITVVARNMSGLDTFGYSNGIRIGRLVSGTVTLQNYIGDRTAPVVDFEIRNVGGGVALQTASVHLNAAGQYSFNTLLNPGNYDIYCKPSHWLKRKVGNVLITGTGVAVNFSTINGDVDWDNEVTLADYARLASAFGSVPGDGNWNPNADLDGDLEVTLADYSILAQRFGLAGDD